MKKLFVTVAIVALASFGAAADAAFTWTPGQAVLKAGSPYSMQVVELQKCLAELGNNPAYNVDGLYGPVTASAVRSFQANYNLTNPGSPILVDGIIGNQTGPLYVAACADAMDDAGDDEGDDEGDNDDSDNGSFYDGSEGSVDSYTLASADETEALEAQEEVEIYAVDVELDEDGDLMLDRVDVWFSQTATADDDPWEYFKSIALLVDGEIVAEEDADSKSDWTDASDGELATANTDNEYRMRFSGVDSVFEAGETTKVSIAVTTVNTIDSNDQDAVWVVEIDDDGGFKWIDGTEFTFTEGAALEDSFTMGAKDTASIDMSFASSNPDASVIEVGDSAETNDVTLAIFNIEEDQDVDATIDTITAELTIVDPAGGVDPAGAGTVIKKAYLVVDGDVIGSESVAATADAVTVTFDNLAWDISGDDDVDVEVVVDLYDTNNAARYDEGTTVAVTDFDITEIDDNNGNDEGDITTLTFATDANAHELRTQGIMVSFVSASKERTFIGDAAGEDDQGEYLITFEVTAFGADMYLDKSTEDDNGANAAGQGVVFDITSSAGTPAVSSSLLESSTTDSQDNANVFQVEEDDTREFTLNVVLTADTTPTDGSHEVILESINWGTATDNTNASYYTFNLEDFKTGSLYLNAQ